MGILHVLHLEDDPLDAELILETLAAGGVVCKVTRVVTRAEFCAALEDHAFDLILADYSLPAFDGVSALAIAEKRCPEVPFLFVSGAIGEELAIESLKRGATDYVLKQRLSRLFPAVRRALREAEERAERRRAEEAVRFLAEASTVLASSLDYSATLAKMARLAVPYLADWCLIDLVASDCSCPQWMVAHVDPAKEDVAREMRRRYPLLPDSSQPLMQVLSTGRSQLLSDVSDALLKEIALDSEHLRFLRVLSPRLALLVPLMARDRLLGTIAFVASESGHRYGLDDLALAEDLARRASVAIDNALLYHDAQEAIRVRDEFLATVSHDLKSPLVSIKGLAQLLQRHLSRDDPPDRARLRDGLERIDATATRMTAAINTLLDVARLQMGQPLAFDQRPTDLVALARQAVTEHQAVTDRHRIEIETTLDELVGEWDTARLEGVIANLLSNAIKYSPGGGNVTVRVKRENEAVEMWAILEVQDTGIGIPAADLSRIFERFHRGTNVVGLIAGSGIGLAGTRQVVEQHGGTISVVSKEGVGSCFTVRLPLH